MFSKTIISIVLFCILNIYAFSQESVVIQGYSLIEKINDDFSIKRNAIIEDETIIFKVTSFNTNGVNMDKLALQKEVHLMFYPDEDGELVFANVWGKEDIESYSSGYIYDLKIQDYEESEDEYARQVISFVWNFANSYDDDSGSAKVTLTRIFTEEMIKFNCTIYSITKNDILVLKGFQLK